MIGPHLLRVKSSKCTTLEHASTERSASAISRRAFGEQAHSFGQLTSTFTRCHDNSRLSKVSAPAKDRERCLRHAEDTPSLILRSWEFISTKFGSKVQALGLHTHLRYHHSHHLQNDYRSLSLLERQLAFQEMFEGPRGGEA